MKVRVTYEAPGLRIDEIFIGPTCEVVLMAMKHRAASEAGFAARLVINGMSMMGFAQEVVRRYNRSAGKSLPIPETCQEFLRLAESEGIATILED
jgi:hypothetical protein